MKLFAFNITTHKSFVVKNLNKKPLFNQYLLCFCQIYCKFFKYFKQLKRLKIKKGEFKLTPFSIKKSVIWCSRCDSNARPSP